MANRLFVGSLAFSVTNEELEAFFAEAGTVASAEVIIDRATKRSKGYGFVEMETEEGAKAAIEQLDGQELNGRPIAVDHAKPKSTTDRRPAGGGNGGRPPRRDFNDRRY